ncbi:hypothetical protein A9Q73_07265 [Bermanella sp. 47_1433_sub80_T6]|nr:hypothetical protein A9Q73_07265 [Bermanella sp. 47_1433_sub80_T6]
MSDFRFHSAFFFYLMLALDLSDTLLSSLNLNMLNLAKPGQAAQARQHLTKKGTLKFRVP